MPKPAIHVFLGAGPANLHRALALRNIDPDAKFVFIDKRLQPDNPDERIERDRSRANIFRFETDEVTQLLINEGVNPKDMEPLVFERQFVQIDPLTQQRKKPVFQMGDDRVFSPKPFTQIQIRDLQLLLLKSIEQNSVDNAPLLIQKDLLDPKDFKPKDAMDQTLPPPPITEQVQKILHENASTLGISDDDVETQNIHIHVATGALRGNEEKDEIIYADQTDIEAQAPEESLTSDVALMTVTPTHGTVTFKIDPVYCEVLKVNQVSLDDTEWQAPLKEFGWDLIRPPRIRVFYTNDILYIGAEIPHSMMSIKDTKEYEKAVTNYTRKIGELIFPQLKEDIKALEVNEHLRSRFPTSRGQRGEVLKIERTDPHTGERLPNNITTYYHGDSRYLPHYQTGSGFITAFLENELYVSIYKQKNIDSMLDWLYQQEGTAGIKDTQKYTKDTIIDQYSRDLPPDSLPAVREEYALEAFKAEVFKQRSLDIIEKNQEKVGRYLNALNSQTMEMLTKNLTDFLKSFNHHTNSQLKLDAFENCDNKHAVIAILQSGNAAFLREQMPKLLNIDFHEMTDEKIFHLRDMLVKDLKFSLLVDDVQIKTNCDSHELCHNFQTSSDKKEMRVIEDSIKSIDLNINAAQISMVKAALLDYTKGNSWLSKIFPDAWCRIFTGAWNRSSANIEKANEIIRKIDNKEYTSFNELKETIVGLDSNSSIGHGAFKKIIQGIREKIEPNQDDKPSILP